MSALAADVSLDWWPLLPPCIRDNSAIPCKTVAGHPCIMTMPSLQKGQAMGSILQQLHWRNVLATVGSMSLAPYLFIAVLMALLIWTVFMSDAGWKPAGESEGPDAGILAMAFGMMFSLVVGTGVMTLVFYDEPARLAPQERDSVQD
jgi:hypothetical protein